MPASGPSSDRHTAAALPLVDAVLAAHADRLGDDFAGYRHHVHRVAYLCAAIATPTAEAFETIAIAAVFHDLGIWTHRTFDYLGPSQLLAADYLRRSGRDALIPLVSAMIADHHKITAATAAGGSDLVEAFRRADWADVTVGVRAFGVSRSVIWRLYGRWPDAGFHRTLLRLSLRRVRSHPRSPLPMVKY